MFLIVLIVSFVSDLFLLNLSDFFDFIMIDVEHLSHEGHLIKILLGLSSVVRILEANKGIDGLSLFAENLDTFNFSKFTKVLTELLLSGGRWEVLDIKVASLFRVLEPHLVLLLFQLSV